MFTFKYTKNPKWDITTTTKKKIREQTKSKFGERHNNNKNKTVTKASIKSKHSFKYYS